MKRERALLGWNAVYNAVVLELSLFIIDVKTFLMFLQNIKTSYLCFKVFFNVLVFIFYVFDFLMFF